MRIFLRNSDIAKKLNISPQTPANWIKQAEKGNINLHLGLKNNKLAILDSVHNWTVMNMLKEKGHRYVSTNRKTVHPSDYFYDLFSKRQVTQIYSSLSSRREIPYKFSYVDQGADLWSDHYDYGKTSEANYVKIESEMVYQNLSMLISSFKQYKRINIFDLGCGTGEPAFPLIEMTQEKGFEVTYTALDISAKMLDIARSNIKSKFQNIKYDEEMLDFDTTNFSDLLYFAKDNENESINLILFLGGTIGNQSDMTRFFANLRDSMGQGDLLVITTGVDTGNVKTTISKPNKYHLNRTTWIPDELGFKGYYNQDDVYDEYDIHNSMMARQITLLDDISVQFDVDGVKNTVQFNRGDSILVFRFYMHTLNEILQQIDDRSFQTRQMFTSDNGRIALLVVQPKKSIY